MITTKSVYMEKNTESGEVEEYKTSLLYLLRQRRSLLRRIASNSRAKSIISLLVKCPLAAEALVSLFFRPSLSSDWWTVKLHVI